MKIQKIISSIEANRAKNLARRNENRINAFVRIHDKDTYGDSYQQMHQAREIIANYAQRNGVSVDISKASRLIEGDETAPSYIKEYAADKINVSVQNILTGESKNTFVSANTEKHYPKVAIKPLRASMKSVLSVKFIVPLTCSLYALVTEVAFFVCADMVAITLKDRLIISIAFVFILSIFS